MTSLQTLWARRIVMRGGQCAGIALTAALIVGCRGSKEAETAPVVTIDVAPVLLSQIQQTVRTEGL
jgi:hypothetical protein